MNMDLGNYGLPLADTCEDNFVVITVPGCAGLMVSVKCKLFSNFSVFRSSQLTRMSD